MSSAPDNGSRAANMVTARRHFDEVLNLGHLHVVDEIYSEDYVLDAPFSPDGTARPHALTSGRHGLKERVTLFRTAFPDITFTVDELLADGNAVVARYTFVGTHLGAFGDIEPTGRKVAISGILVAHLSGAIIYEAFSAFDSGEMMRQLAAA
jgi:predicted ester cyclase